MLLVANDCARRLGVDIWQFAVALAELRQAGLSDTDMRVLVQRNLVEHGVEVTRRKDPRRTFCRTANLALFERSCLVLSPAGLELACQDRVRLLDNGPPAQGPWWDADTRTLYVDGGVVKRFRNPAPGQHAVLQAFQDQHWPGSVLVPPPDDASVDVVGWLRETVKNLNRNVRPHLRFRQEVRRVAWETDPQAAADSAGADPAP
jgi:hypothetical protein